LKEVRHGWFLDGQIILAKLPHPGNFAGLGAQGQLHFGGFEHWPGGKMMKKGFDMLGTVPNMWDLSACSHIFPFINDFLDQQNGWFLPLFFRQTHIVSILVGGLEHLGYFSTYWEFHIPN
jgi:hypothetical protein